MLRAELKKGAEDADVTIKALQYDVALLSEELRGLKEERDRTALEVEAAREAENCTNKSALDSHEQLVQYVTSALTRDNSDKMQAMEHIMSTTLFSTATLQPSQCPGAPPNHSPPLPQSPHTTTAGTHSFANTNAARIGIGVRINVSDGGQDVQLDSSGVVSCLPAIFERCGIVWKGYSSTTAAARKA